MTTIGHRFYTFVQHFFNKMAYRSVPLAPAHLKLSLVQRNLLECYMLRKIRLDYRTRVGAIVQRNYWGGGENETLVPSATQELLPRDVLLITRKGVLDFELRAGPGYDDMSAETFQEVLTALIENAVTTIRSMSMMYSIANSLYEDSDIGNADNIAKLQ